MCDSSTADRCFHTFLCSDSPKHGTIQLRVALLVLREIKRLLDVTTSHLTSLWWAHFQDLECRAASYIRDILRSNKDELAVAHRLPNFNEGINDELSRYRVQLQMRNKKIVREGFEVNQYHRSVGTDKHEQLTKTSNSSMTRNGVSNISPKASRSAMVLLKKEGD
jgi:hypothetical protein